MKGLLRSARDVSLGTFASRLLGLARDIACAAYFSPYSLDAFYLAFTVPNLLRRLLGEGALTSSFVPVFAEIREKEGLAGAAEFTRTTFTVLAVVLVGCFVILRTASFCAAGWFTSPKAWLTFSLLDVMLPFLVFVCLSALLAAALNSTGAFGLPAAGPAILNAFWIAGVLVLGRTLGVAAAAAGVLVGVVVQCAVLAAAAARRGIRIAPRWNPAHPGLLKVVRLSGPVVFGLVLFQLNVLADRIIAEIMIPGNGAVSALYFGNRLIQLPLGVFGIAMATAVFPRFSSCAAMDDHEGMKVAMRQALRTVFFVAVPSAVALVALREEVVRLLFQHGKFGPEMTQRTGTVIAFYAAGLWAYCGVHLATRLLYSLQDMKSPVRIASAMVAVNLILNLLLVGPMQESGLALATAVTSAITFVLLLVGSARRIGVIGLSEVGVSFLKICGCSALMGLAVSATAGYINTWMPGDSFMGRLAAVAIPGIVGLGVLAVSAVALRCREIREIKEAFPSRKG